MKVRAIKAEIVKKYQSLDSMAHIKPKDNVTIPLWKLNMGNWGVSETFGDIWCKKPQKADAIDTSWKAVTLEDAKKEMKRATQIKANIKNDVKIDIKPFWMSKRHALKEINKALDMFIKNYNTPAVEKSEAPIVCHTDEFINCLLGKNSSFKYVKFNK